MYHQLVNAIGLMAVSLMAIVATSISALTWGQVIIVAFAMVIMTFVYVELECGENKKERS